MEFDLVSCKPYNLSNYPPPPLIFIVLSQIPAPSSVLLHSPLFIRVHFIGNTHKKIVDPYYFDLSVLSVLKCCLETITISLS